MDFPIRIKTTTMILDEMCDEEYGSYEDADHPEEGKMVDLGYGEHEHAVVIFARKRKQGLLELRSLGEARYIAFHCLVNSIDKFHGHVDEEYDNNERARLRRRLTGFERLLTEIVKTTGATRSAA